MRAAKQKERNDAHAEATSLQRQLDDVNAWLDAGRKAGLGDATLPDRSAELPQLPTLERELGTLRETIALLSTPERAARQERLMALDKQKTDLDRQIGGLANPCRNSTFAPGLSATRLSRLLRKWSDSESPLTEAARHSADASPGYLIAKSPRAAMTFASDTRNGPIVSRLWRMQRRKQSRPPPMPSSAGTTSG